MNIPCKTNKCILYPVCLSKQVITCRELILYYKSLDSFRHETDMAKIIHPSYIFQFEPWKELSKSFPNLIALSDVPDVEGGGTHIMFFSPDSIGADSGNK